MIGLHTYVPSTVPRSSFHRERDPLPVTTARERVTNLPRAIWGADFWRSSPASSGFFSPFGFGHEAIRNSSSFDRDRDDRLRGHTSGQCFPHHRDDRKRRARAGDGRAAGKG